MTPKPSLHKHVRDMSDPPASASAVGLRYVNDSEAGFSRLKRGNGFVFVNQKGKPLRNESVLKRLRALVIPPAWRDVWICPDARGHLQATGRDARGRKQHIYHERWREVRDE